MVLGKWQEQIKTGINKYKYVVLVLVIGMVLMSIPQKEVQTLDDTQSKEENAESTMDLATQLMDILSNISGAGKVKVMLSIERGEQIIYQTDTTYNQSENQTDTRTQTILITNGNREEDGLIQQKNPPKYQGAVVLAQGADDPTVKLALVDAVMKATGLGADKISVLKMK